MLHMYAQFCYTTKGLVQAVQLIQTIRKCIVIENCLLYARLNSLESDRGNTLLIKITYAYIGIIRDDTGLQFIQTGIIAHTFFVLGLGWKIFHSNELKPFFDEHRKIAGLLN